MSKQDEKQRLPTLSALERTREVPVRPGGFSDKAFAVGFVPAPMGPDHSSRVFNDIAGPDPAPQRWRKKKIP